MYIIFLHTYFFIDNILKKNINVLAIAKQIGKRLTLKDLYFYFHEKKFQI